MPNYNKMIYAKSSTPWMDIYAGREQEEVAQNNQRIAQLNAERDADIAKSDAGYAKNATQNWINYMQAQKNLPSDLNALGIRGGATESSLIRMGTTYGSNVAQNEMAKQSAANDIRSAYAKQINDANAESAARLAEIRAAAKENQFKWEEEQKSKDLEQFQNVIEGLYTKKESYKKLIEKLKKSNDPNKKMKIMLARRAMNQIQGSGGSGGSGGRGGRSYGGGGYSSGGGYDSGSSDLTNKMYEYRVNNYKKKSTGKTTGKSRSIKGDTYTVTSKGSYRAKR